MSPEQWNPLQRQQQKYRMLIIEEDPEVRMEYKELLDLNHFTTFNNYENVKFASSIEAAAKYFHHEFDYAVVSCSNGHCFEAYQKIKLRDKFEDARKIIVSDNKTVLDICINENIYFAEKPIDLEGIFDKK